MFGILSQRRFCVYRRIIDGFQVTAKYSDGDNSFSSHMLPDVYIFVLFLDSQPCIHLMINNALYIQHCSLKEPSAILCRCCTRQLPDSCHLLADQDPRLCLSFFSRKIGAARFSSSGAWHSAPAWRQYGVLKFGDGWPQQFGLIVVERNEKIRESAVANSDKFQWTSTTIY